MRARVAWHRGRSASVAGAALAALLVFLAHMLACSHGDAVDEARRADAVVVASVASGGQAVTWSDHAGGGPAEHDGHGHVGCSDADSPTVQPTRTTVPAPDSVQHSPHSETTGVSAAPATAGAPPGRHCGPSPVGVCRSRLGVWRT
ncbi:hypothetical protein [Streptomyces sp. SAI-090]|jgi:hypothetical protein|uniref:hypothetical protein n=1 Tax=Streptomyces sp. SAI-090 TaxID=2940545 RepID=UPI00247423AE|nr:hypothetical protein [Streptomyces sp. SAI-090]MDH6522284.1 hypothetical protein [Streptomyces sp. SAI-090]